MNKQRIKRSNGEGSIYLRQDGRWTAAYYVLLPAGGRKRRYIYGATATEIENQLVDIRKQTEAGIPFTPAGLTVGEYLNEWVNHIAAPRVRTSTETTYRILIRKYLSPKLGRKFLGKLTARDVRHFLADLQKDAVGARTIQYAHATLRAALEDATREEIVTRNVAKLVKAPKPERKEFQPLTLEESKTLLRSVRGHRLEALFIVFVLLGMRRSEVLALKWENVDLEKRTLRIRKTLHRTKDGIKLLDTKTQRSNRTIPLPAVVTKALEAHQFHQETERLALGRNWPNLGFVFTTPGGTPIDPRNCTRLIQNQCKTAGIPIVRLHDLRHGCVSVLLAMGVSPRTVMEIVGHTTLEMTMNTYGHVTLDDKRAALDELGKLLEE